MKRFTRREFIKAGTSLVAACGIAEMTGCEKTTRSKVYGPKDGGPVALPTRPFGSTGFNVGIFSLGGQAALETPGQEDVSEEIINRALDLGVNYLDTSAYYGGGLSERNIGRAIQGRRDQVFIATKSVERYRDAALRDLEQSLENLQTDHVDLWQIHNVRQSSDVNSLLGHNGGFEAFERARDEGTARFIGVSGHYSPNILVQMITRRDFDAVLMALNAADVHYRSFINIALPEAVSREMGIIAMKIPARGRLFREGGVTTMKEALGYTLTHPVSTAIVGCSTVEDLEENVQLAKDFEPFSDEEMQRLEDLTASYYREGAWFKYEW